MGFPTSINPPDFLVVVSGLPRSGTSLMMQMLAAGGLPILTDGRRPPDENNSRGYLEHERVKRLRTETDFTWLRDARASAVKVIHLLLTALPADLPCRVILMRRPIAEVVASQRAMLRRDGRAGASLSDERLGQVLLAQLHQAEEWLGQQADWKVHPVDYAAAVERPLEQASAIGDFIGADLDLAAMAAAVDPRLRRERAD